ncbi:DUF2946 family protein [Methylocella tundrae]|uniref:DUF2946 domain-containing protein n=1 Tax=Methylocella tundrae TaxID=227605 RepID=A0A4U8Z0V8_METTU|nr:DUF2946 family protein [Methylocella tundrae]WPP06239.1 DUF2946 domain-containing protein [Methylocella tundrae]VFU08908.1 conserved exported protein of unknown function [Methylocella tundrae]
MTAMRSQWSFWVALAAAYLLAAQSFLGAQALASGRIGPGAIICSAQAQDAPKGPRNPLNHGAPPHCCLAGCCMFGQGGALTPASPSLIARQPIEVTASGGAGEESFVPPQRRNPHSPRAPPPKGSRFV